jgi:hypothetical protein
VLSCCPSLTVPGLRRLGRSRKYVFQLMGKQIFLLEYIKRVVLLEKYP